MTPHSLDSSIPPLGISRTLTARIFKSRLKWAQSWRRNFFFATHSRFIIFYYFFVCNKHASCLYAVNVSPRLKYLN